jgi:hypothetical protein
MGFYSNKAIIGGGRMDKINDPAKCKGCNYMNISDYSLRLRHCKKCNNYGEKIKEVDITVKQIPVSVGFDCPHCEEEIKIDYQEFCGDVGDPGNWPCSEIDCPGCGKKIKIDNIDWD